MLNNKEFLINGARKLLKAALISEDLFFDEHFNRFFVYNIEEIYQSVPEIVS